jgi:hypothetical protein
MKYPRVILIFLLIVSGFAFNPSFAASAVGTAEVKKAASDFTTSDYDDVDQFVTALESKGVGRDLEALVTAFNRYQFKKSGLDPENMDSQDTKSGMSILQIKETEASNFIPLEVRRVTKDHTASMGIDDGEDQISTIYFSKSTYIKIIEVTGAPNGFPQAPELLLVPGDGKSSCAGASTPASSFAVIDLSSKGKTLFESPYADGPQSYEVSASAGNLILKTRTETQMETPEEASGCEVGDKVWISEKTYQLSCTHAGCVKKMGKSKRYKGCQNIGSCD